MVIEINRHTFGIFLHKTGKNGSPDLQTEEDERKVRIIYGFLYSPELWEWHSPSDFDLATGDVIRSADGTGTYIEIDKPNKRLVMYTDPYRLYLPYLWQDEVRVLIADSLTELSQMVTLTPSEKAIAQLITINTTIGKETIYNEIELAEEGSVYEFNFSVDKIVKSVTPFRPFPAPDGQVYHADDLAQACSMNLMGGLKLGESFSFALTAGLDSRAILAMSYPEKEKLKAYTHGFEDSMDVKVARKLAGAVGLDYRLYDLGDPSVFTDKLTDCFETVNRYYEGSLNALSHSHAVISYTGQQDRAGIFLSSFGGELLRSYYLPAGVDEHTGLDEWAERIFGISAVPLLDPVFKDAAATKEQVLQGIYNELALCPVKGNPEYLADFYYHRRNFNGVTTRFAGKYFKVFSPYFQKDLFKMLPGVDPVERKNGRIQKRMVTLNNDHLSRYLLNQKEPVKDGFLPRMRAKSARADYYAKVLINKLTNRWAVKLYFTDYHSWITKDHADWFRSIFEDELPVQAGLELDRIRKFVQEWLEGEQPFKYYKVLTNMSSTLWYLQQIRHV